mmetsp:Transcript_9712/g.29429  ORF Transcript_9712/g.29429 Transcript_9712/m.29429 type:complete len:202 (-) Transcript_9712:1083-1688(-)|eukprot:86339-Chlamydomonas_euryale.AAC.3
MDDDCLPALSGSWLIVQPYCTSDHTVGAEPYSLRSKAWLVQRVDLWQPSHAKEAVLQGAVRTAATSPPYGAAGVEAGQRLSWRKALAAPHVDGVGHHHASALHCACRVLARSARAVAVRAVGVAVRDSVGSPAACLMRRRAARAVEIEEERGGASARHADRPAARAGCRRRVKSGRARSGCGVRNGEGAPHSARGCPRRHQ